MGAGPCRELGHPTPGPASWGLPRGYGTLCTPASFLKQILAPRPRGEPASSVADVLWPPAHTRGGFLAHLVFPLAGGSRGLPSLPSLCLEVLHPFSLPGKVPSPSSRKPPLWPILTWQGSSAPLSPLSPVFQFFPDKKPTGRERIVVCVCEFLTIPSLMCPEK